MAESVSIIPSWRAVVPVLVTVAENATKPEARREALDQLLRLADVADKLVPMLRDALAEARLALTDYTELVDDVRCEECGGRAPQDEDTGKPTGPVVHADGCVFGKLDAALAACGVQRKGAAA